MIEHVDAQCTRGRSGGRTTLDSGLTHFGMTHCKLLAHAAVRPQAASHESAGVPAPGSPRASSGRAPAVLRRPQPARPRSTLGYMLPRHAVRAAGQCCPAARCPSRSSRIGAATRRPRLWSSAAAAVSAGGSKPSVAQRSLGWLFTGGAVAAACGLANHVCDNPVFCQLAVELAQRDPRVAAAAGGAVSAKWWYDATPDTCSPASQSCIHT